MKRKFNRYFLSYFALIMICAFLLPIVTGCSITRTYGHPAVSSDTSKNPKENYFVLLSGPPQNHTFEPTDPPPVFSWDVLEGLPQVYTIEIDYKGDGYCITGTTTGTHYSLPEEDWNIIIRDAPRKDGLQKISWQIRIDDTMYPEEGPYYSGWGYFWIKSD